MSGMNKKDMRNFQFFFHFIIQELSNADPYALKKTHLKQLLPEVNMRISSNCMKKENINWIFKKFNFLLNFLLLFFLLIF